jgi:hypothetical protein
MHRYLMAACVGLITYGVADVTIKEREIMRALAASDADLSDPLIRPEATPHLIQHTSPSAIKPKNIGEPPLKTAGAKVPGCGVRHRATPKPVTPDDERKLQPQQGSVKKTPQNFNQAGKPQGQPSGAQDAPPAFDPAKPLHLLFTTDRCTPCDQAKVLLNDPKLRAWRPHFSTMVINANREPEMAARYGVTRFPTDVFVGKVCDGDSCREVVCDFVGPAGNVNAYCWRFVGAYRELVDPNFAQPKMIGLEPTPARWNDGKPYDSPVSRKIQEWERGLFGRRK